MAQISIDPQDVEYRQKLKDEELCKKIVEVLAKDEARRVLLAGEAGIGKTRLAKKVAEYVTVQEHCFLSLCLHLNQKFEDQWSLYENIASQLSVYSDFEETEIDDRDEDEDEEEEKNARDVDAWKKKIVDDLKKKIVDEIEKKRKFLVDKKKKEKEDKEKQKEKEKGNKGGKPVKETGKKNTAKGAEKTAQEEIKDESYLLLILDDEGNKTSEDAVMNGLELEKFLINQDFLKDQDKRLKIIVTRRKGDEKEPTKSEEKTESNDEKSDQGSEKQEEEAKSESEIQSDGETESQKKNNEEESEPQAKDGDGESVPPTGAELKVDTKIYDKIVFLTTDESQHLVDSINEDTQRDIFLSLTPEEWKTDMKFIDKMVKESKKSPAAIAVLAKSLKQITRSTSNPGKEKIEKLIEEVLSADRPETSSLGSVNPILHLAYVLLETYVGQSKDAILDCFWHSFDFFDHCGCVYYRDLITQWVLEGYFDPVRSVEKAYQDGHSILMELINRGMLRIQENNVVVPEIAMRNLLDPRPHGHLGRSRLGFSRVYAGEKSKGIGKITQIDDMIKTVQARKKDKVTTILVSGDRLRRVTPEKYFKKLGDLEVLSLFEPTLEPFITSFSSLDKLRVLVIRDCDLLTDIEELKALRELNALEVSGASSLKRISDDFFKALTKLKSLHLSGLLITSSPSSISQLMELHCLIIKDCPLLEDLPDIQELTKLEVVDVSGAHGLQTCFDNTKGEKKNKSKNKNFYHLTKLQLLDFSESQIERLPIFQDSAEAKRLHTVTRLLLRDCKKLRRLPSLKPLSGLQILDLSGTTNLVEMLEVCFEDKKELRTLNLSRTNLSELATTIDELTNLNELLLKDSTNIEVIPNIENLINLEFVDVSGCTKLEKIEGSFQKMSYLREVNLAGTKVTILPEFLPKESIICCPKRITLANGRHLERENWDEVKKAMASETSENASSSTAVVTSREISENVSEETGEVQSNEQRLLHVPTEKAPYKDILSLFASASPQEVIEISETNELDDEALANVEAVTFVDCSSTRLTSIFDKTTSMKVCWLRMCIDTKDLFSGVAEEHLESLETLSITNLPSLETISCAGSLKNLKELSIDCCPNIKTLFPEMPSNLKFLHIKHCEKLEKLVAGSDVPSFTVLDVDKSSCPNYKENSGNSDWSVVDPRDASLQE